MELYEIILLVGIPIILWINGTIAKNKRESGSYKTDEVKKVDSLVGKVGCILGIIWIVIGSMTFFKYCVPERPKPIETSYSSYAVDTADERITTLQSEGLLRLGLDNYEAHVSLSFWDKMDLEAKKEFFSTILIYAETETGKKFSIFEIKSNVDGSVLASYSSISGFDFIPEK